MQSQHSSAVPRQRLLPDGSIDYAYYRQVAQRERRLAQARLLDALGRGMSRAAAAIARAALRCAAAARGTRRPAIPSR